MWQSLTVAAAITALGIASLALADQGIDGSVEGILNPEELSIRGALDRLRHDEADPMLGIYGYAAAKAGDNVTARELFGHLAHRGNPEAMEWMAWLEDNGLGGPEAPDKAAEWDRRAMVAGSEIGQFNYGLDLMRGRGVPRDVEAGKAAVREAARRGETSARMLVENDFDLDVVTPDADAWKYGDRLY
ncbi:MAG: sel1 repeat family protein [Rhodobacteraceae bacterium]|nr:sel1 repeat family protein [Paracoccaceae bacterium]